MLHLQRSMHATWVEAYGPAAPRSSSPALGRGAAAKGRAEAPRNTNDIVSDEGAPFRDHGDVSQPMKAATVLSFRAAFVFSHRKLAVQC